MKKKFILPSLIFWSLSTSAAITTFIPRSQTVNAARDMVGWQQLIYRCDYDCLYQAFAITPTFSQSFNDAKLAQCIFGNDIKICNGQATLGVSSSRVVARDKKDWLGDYFLAIKNYEGTIVFNPTVRNVTIDLQYYAGFNALCADLYFRVHVPVVHTRWHLNFCENIKQGVSNGMYQQGYFSGNEFEGFSSVTPFFTGNRGVERFLDESCFGNVIKMQNLKFSKWAANDRGCDGHTRTHLGDIELEFGRNFCCDESLFAISLRASIPTGNRVTGEFLFEPLIGDGNHAKLGVGIHAQHSWCQDDARTLGIYFDGHLNHLFNAQQCRVFDLRGKPNSRYMIAQRLGTIRGPAFINNSESDAGVEFQDEYAPIANLTHAAVNVDVAVEGDLAIKLGYTRCNWTFDVGYNFWGRSRERICKIKKSCAGLSDGQTWALKGDASVIGFVPQIAACVRLAAVEAEATINKGTNNYTGPGNFDGGVNGIPPSANPGITNRQIALFNGLPIMDPNGEPIFSSNPVLFLTQKDIDLTGYYSYSHSLFTHLSYAWQGSCYTPFFGIGGQAEFAQNKCAVQRCGLDQWSIWIKGGAAF